MVKMILLFLLLLLSLVQYRAYYNGGTSLTFEGPIQGTIILAIVCLVFIVQIARAFHRVSKAAGIEPAPSPYRYLPLLFLIPWLIGLRYFGEYKDFPSWGKQLTWEFIWGQSGWKIFLMVGLLLALYLNKLKKRIAELEKRLSGENSLSEAEKPSEATTV
jgi:hypothetical protein